MENIIDICSFTIISVILFHFLIYQDLLYWLF